MDTLAKSKKFETSYKDKMENKIIHDFVVLLFVYYDLMSTPRNRDMRDRGMNDVRKLFFETMIRNKEYFIKNNVLVSDYKFICKVIEYLENCRNNPVLRK